MDNHIEIGDWVICIEPRSERYGTLDIVYDIIYDIFSMNGKVIITFKNESAWSSIEQFIKVDPDNKFIRFLSDV